MRPLSLLVLRLTRLLVVSSIWLRSCLDLLRSSLDWAVDAVNALRASLRLEVFTRLVGTAEQGAEDGGGGRGGLLQYHNIICLLRQQGRLPGYRKRKRGGFRLDDRICFYNKIYSISDFLW